MLRRLKSHASPAMVVAMTALIVALAGTAVAGGVLNKKKVNTIINNRAAGLSVLKAKSADSATKAGNVFGASANASGALTTATLAGTSVQKTSNVFRYTFPRSVQGCVPVAGGSFSSDFVAILAGTANPNSIDVTFFSGVGDNSLIVTCP
jgi:hypothetical protein